jgi:lipopolysaccharide/colanic/teichoic acid biosynthesis glycosyltransferase
MAADGLRRLLDLLVAGAGLFLLSPLLLLVAILIKLDSPGPVFYRAKRVGQYGRLFHLLKFRSMVSQADRQGPAITSAGDSRITRLGAFLRRSKLDELPQLINVIRGEIALVGPRPEDPRYVALYTQEQRRILQARPGITSAASLAYRHEAELLAGPDWERRYREEVLPAKLTTDLDYLHQRTLWSDFKLILATIYAMAQ